MRERVALTIGATLLGFSVAAVIARRPFRRLAAAVSRRSRRRIAARRGPEEGETTRQDAGERDVPASLE